MDLFDLVKSRVDIVQYIESLCGCQARKSGADYFINPCPLPGCGHNDCFSMNKDKQFFKCFSCGRGGTVIDFEMLYKGVSEPLEAAKEIAWKEGIDLEEIQGQRRGESAASSKKSKAGEAEKEEPEAIPVEVLDGYQPLPGQVKGFLSKERGWSQEIIAKYQIGYNVKLKRITIPIFDGQGRLMNVRQYLPKAARNKMISFGRGFGQARLFPLSVLEDVKPAKDFVLLCEGEPDTMFALSQGLIAVTTTGGSGTWNPDWNRYFEGLQVVIAYDNDSPGRQGGEKVGKSLLGIARSVEIVQWPDFMEGGQDLTDWFVTHGKSAKELLGLPRKKIDKGSGKRTTKKKVISNLVPDDTVYDFESFQVVGELEDCRIIIESLDIRKIHIIPLKEMTLERCLQFGGPEVRFRVERRMEAVSDALRDGNPNRKVHFYDFRRNLILQAREKQLGPLRWVGQGIYTLEDDRFLIVNGNSTFLWDGKVFAEFNGAVVEDKIISRNAGRVWINSEKLIKEVLNLNREGAQKIINELTGQIQQWGFAGAFDVALVSGFLLAQIVESIWDWRPHLWVSGRHGSGKTLLLTLFEEMGGRLARRFEGSSTSEAGFRQSVKQDFCLISLDEFEKSQSREQILSYLRTAGRGGVIAKGSPGQESVEYSLKHMVLCASIESGLARAAEKTRFIPIETKKDPDRDPHLPVVLEMESFRLRVFALAIWGALNARKRIRELQRIPEIDARLMEAYAVPLAMLTVADDDPQDSLQKILETVLFDQEESGQDSIPEDEDRLLDDILSSTTRVDVEDDGRVLTLDRSVGWLLKSRSRLHQEALQTVGIKQTAEGVFFACSVIERQLLQDTRWRGMNIMSILKRLPGAERVKKRIAGRQPYGVFFSKMGGLLGSKSGMDEDENDLLFT